MVTEDYINFETAELLKEKGMNKFCFKHYVQKNNNDGTSEAVTVCTLQMAMKWLREKHNIFIEISVDEELDEHGYQWALFDNTTKRIRPYAGWGDTYEQSCEKAIKYCLEKLI